MNSVAHPTDKPKAYFAQLDGASGVLTRPYADVLFFDSETRQITRITHDNVHLLVRLQEVGEFMAVYYADRAREQAERGARTTTPAARAA